MAPIRPDTTAQASLSAKILSLPELRTARADAEREGRSVVHCHGCFDIVHPGHVRHLQHAAGLGDRLLVSITADLMIQKGDGRPLFDQDLRAENIAALSCVDWVCVSPEPTAEHLLEAVRPDIYVKGREYEANDDPRFVAERAAVERHGGRVVFSSGDVVFSSTALVEAIRHGDGAADGRFEDPIHARLRTLRRSHELTGERVASLLGAIRGRSIVVVGEPIVDTYVQCAWPEVSGESPVLSLRPVERTSYDGGAAILACHAAALGARATLVTALPDSDEAHALRRRLEDEGVRVVAEVTRTRLPEKQRLMVGPNKLVKLDHTDPITLDASATASLIERAGAEADNADAAIATDYGLGMLGPRAIAELCARLRPRVGTLGGDVSGSRASLFAMHGADWLSPSERELRGALGNPDDSLPAITWDLVQRTDARHVAITMAADGLVAFERRGVASGHDGRPSRLSGEHLPSLAAHAVDPLGCGDALLTGAVLALAAGATIVEASYLGSLAAAIESEQLGNVPVGAHDLARRARRLDEAPPVIHRVTPRRFGAEAS
ncbi:MAG: PfkB family carbohydrate kinase [Planctomycetota bacterium]